jgi:hypothetical protein
MLPHDQEAVWRLTSGGAVYVVGDPERAGKCLVTLAVADLEAHVSRLRAEGLAFAEEAEGPAPPGDQGRRREQDHLFPRSDPPGRLKLVWASVAPMSITARF